MSHQAWARELKIEDLAPSSKFKGLWRRYVEPSGGSRGLIFAMGMLQPGEDAGWHAHPEEEVFFVVSGRGRALWREGDLLLEADLHPGMAFYKQGGVPHQLECIGSEPLVGVACKV